MSAADIEDVGWPEPAAVLQRIESTRSCWPSWRTKSRSVVDCVAETAMELPSSEELGASRREFGGISVDSPISLRSGQSLHFADHVVEDRQAGVPEPRIGDVHADPPDQLVRPRRAARGQEVDVLLDERRALLEVAVVDRQREEVPERVGVDVARRVDEVADVAPPHLVLVRER